MKFVFKNLMTVFFILINSFYTIVVAQRSEEKLGWKLGAQAYTFRPYTFFEVLDRLDSCNLKFVGASPGRDIGGGMEGKMAYTMSTEYQRQILKKLSDKGIKIISYGVVVPKTKLEWVKLFEFAKNMGIKTIVSEPLKEDLPMLSKLCDRYKINLAIHNHPRPSLYWEPEIVLNSIKGLSKRLGACADVGHWVRSGLDPLESIKKLKGHIIELHFKDLNEKSKDAHDVPWGTGICQVEDILKELKKQRFKGAFMAEYEYKWEHNTPEVDISAKYFREVVKKMNKDKR